MEELKKKQKEEKKYKDSNKEKCGREWNNRVNEVDAKGSSGTFLRS